MPGGSSRAPTLPDAFASELYDHWSRTAFRGDDELVFCHPLTGSVLDDRRYAITLRLAFKRSGRNPGRSSRRVAHDENGEPRYGGAFPCKGAGIERRGRDLNPRRACTLNGFRDPLQSSVLQRV